MNDAKPASGDGLPAILHELDILLATQGKLQFARENYDEAAATVFGVALLDFLRVHGMEVRRRLATPEQPAAHGYNGSELQAQSGHGIEMDPARIDAYLTPEQPGSSVQERRLAPWPDYAGNPIYEGDTIKHPADGMTGVVFVIANETDDHDRWRVLYNGDGTPARVSRLCLQIDYKGQAVVAPPAPAAEQPEARGVDVEAIRRACQSGKRFWQAGPGYYEEIESLLPATPNPVRAEQQGLGAGGRYWRERAEFWRAQAVALGWREVRDAANGEQPKGKWKLPCDVRLPPATTINAGCDLSTLIHAMECRKDAGVVHFPPKSAPAAPGVRVDDAMVGDVRADIMRSAANDGCPIVIKDAWVREALTAALAPDGGEGE